MNSPDWAKAAAQVQTELEMLAIQVNAQHELANRFHDAEPDFVETTAIAAMLHAFYNGLENCLKRLAVNIDGSLPAGDKWHQQLLENMGHATSERPAVLSEELTTKLNEYLRFRHFFRNSYTFGYEWERLKPLFLNCATLLTQFEAEITLFFAVSHER